MHERDSVFDLIRTGNLELLREVLAADPNAAAERHPSGISPVLYARYQWNQDAVDAILAADPPLDVFDAAALGRADIVLDALRANLGVTQLFSSDGFTALHLASYFGHREVVELLVTHGADARVASRNPMMLTALHSAVTAKHADIAAFLLENGADANAIQMGGWTPLHAAAQHGDLALVELLLAHGADRNVVADDGRTPVAMAGEKNHAEVIERLQRA
jgi:ankyrin repeat protein